jgi:hypothetical protein
VVLEFARSVRRCVPLNGWFTNAARRGHLAGRLTPHATANATWNIPNFAFGAAATYAKSLDHDAIKWSRVMTSSLFV